jgi:hypothetical protein
VRAALQTLVVALGLGKRFGGVTLITVDRWTIAEELWLFGEDAIYRVALELSDHDIVRVWVLAGRLLEREKARSAGEAAALAAVAVVEGKRRPLRRKRRRPRAELNRFEKTADERSAEIDRVEESESFPERWR